MGKGEMGETQTSSVQVAGERRVLKEALETHRPELIQKLDSSTLFLTYLAKHKLIEGNDLLRYERHKSNKKRNEEVLESVLRHEADVPDSYNKFLDALKKSDQENLANMITSIEKELDIVDNYQNTLEKHLEDVHKYLKKEQRRTEVNFATQTPQSRVKPSTTDNDNAENTHRAEMADFLKKVHHTTRSTLIQFDRCKDVIEKLHKDCDVVAMKNSDLLRKLRECDDMVKELVPRDALKSLGPVDKDDTMTIMGSALSMNTPRTKRNEAELILHNIKQKLHLIEEDRLAREESNRVCEMILDNILDDVEERKVLLAKSTEPPPKEKKGVNKYTANVPLHGDGGASSRRSSITRLEPLKVKVEELSEVMECYVHQEKQLTHRANINKFSTGLAHRNFDQIDDDLIHLQKEMRRDDKERALEIAKHIVDATKSERDECLKLVDDIEKTVRTRRLKLQESLTRGPSNPRAKRRIPPRRVRVVRKTDSSFQKRLNNLNNEIKTYMSMELEQNQRNQAELTKKKQEYDKEIKDQAQQIRVMEKKMKEMEGEKGKFKRLYNQERVHGSMILNKPTIAGRRNRSTNPDRQAKSRLDDDYKDRREDVDRSKRRKFRVPGAGPVRATTRNNYSDREETPPEARPLLTKKARHLTSIKEDEDRNRLPDIHQRSSSKAY